MLAPPDLPLRRSRAEQFDDLVLDAVEHLETHWADELEGLQFAVEDVPTALADEIATFAADVVADHGVILAELLRDGLPDLPGEHPSRGGTVAANERGGTGGRSGTGERSSPHGTSGGRARDAAGRDTGGRDAGRGAGGRHGARRPDSRRDEPAGRRDPVLVIYRRPVEARTDDGDDRADLVFSLVVELVAEWLGRDVDDIDPR